MARAEVSTTINRPIEEVFAVLSDLSNNPKWASGSVETPKKTSDGPIGVGTTWHTVGKFLGRRIESDAEYTEFEANRKIAATSKSGPFPLEFTMTLEPVDGGTQLLRPDGQFDLRYLCVPLRTGVRRWWKLGNRHGGGQFHDRVAPLRIRGGLGDQVRDVAGGEGVECLLEVADEHPPRLDVHDGVVRAEQQVIRR